LHRSTCAPRCSRLPEFLERRYTPGTRTLLSGIFLASYILTKASVTIFAGAFAIQTILGYQTINLPLFGAVDFFWFSAAFLVIITGVFVIAGGMLSVLWTEAMHVPVLLAGSAVLLFVGLDKIGGWDALARGESGEPASVASRSRPRRRPRDSQDSCLTPVKRPWLGVLLCSPIIGLWYWCTDQYIVQRVLSARGSRRRAAAPYSRRT
jgi:SSS family solute:Na+ symporter